MHRVIQFKRGDPHPCVYGRFFVQYFRGVSKWGTAERLEGIKRAALRCWARHREKRCAELRVSGAKRRAALKSAGPEALRAYYDKYKDKANQSLRARVASDPLFRFKKNITRRIGAAFKYHSARKLLSTHALLGCTLQEARDHIEKLFTAGMTWANHKRGGWHIDHKIPLASATTEQELIALCHYTNLQPLWEPENISKGAKIMAIYLT